MVLLPEGLCARKANIFVNCYSHLQESAIVFFSNLFNFYLFLAVLGLHCCVRAFSSCGEWGLLLVVVCGLLIAVASLVVEHGL